ncbi:MAG: hypothetical protein N3E51_01350 [Candidatus Micrarchaeota archaeon]|nr:hypothetical protein [Candidatus Micrarchaeota archaeon]
MVSLKKYVPCRCGANNFFSFESDMAVEDITLSARCPSCGNSIAISVSSLLSASPQSASQETRQPASQSEVAQAHIEQETNENIEQAVRDLFKY